MAAAIFSSVPVHRLSGSLNPSASALYPGDSFHFRQPNRWPRTCPWIDWPWNYWSAISSRCFHTPPDIVRTLPQSVDRWNANRHNFPSRWPEPRDRRRHFLAFCTACLRNKQYNMNRNSKQFQKFSRGRTSIFFPGNHGKLLVQISSELLYTYFLNF